MRLDSGKLVTFAILGLAAAAAGFAWWHQYQQSRRSLAFWSAEGALLIRRAPLVELIPLNAEPALAANREGSADGDSRRGVGERLDVSHAPGLVHARQALITDSSYVWDAPPGVPVWEYALRFSDGDRTMEILLDLTHGYAGTQRHAPALQLGPTLAHGLRRFFAEQWTPPAQPPTSGNGP